MTCKGCKAVSNWDESWNRKDMTDAKCSLGYETKMIDGIMKPLVRCPKPKSWKTYEKCEVQQ